MRPVLSFMVALGLATVFTATSARAASFNCARASAPDERAICADAGLSDTDEQLAGLYTRLGRLLAGKARADLAVSQHEWLQQRAQCKNDFDCLVTVYGQRAQQLRFLLAGIHAPVESEAAAATGRIAYCTAKQLHIRQIAVDAPGMMHSNAFFTVLNHGSKPCILRAGAGRVWSNDKTPPPIPGETPPSKQSLYQIYLEGSRSSEPDNRERYVLSPVPAGGKMALKDLIGFSVSNSSAGDGDWFSSISVQLPNSEGRPAGRVYKVAYKGSATFPIPKIRVGIQPFLAWKVLEEDSCQITLGTEPLVGVGSKGRDIPARTVDVRQMLQCG